MYRNPNRAVELAKRAVELTPQDGNVWNTLGVAYYRSGNFKNALETLNKSMELQKGGTAIDFFFLAMAHCKTDNEEEARRWYDQAIAWMEKNRAALDRSPSQAEEMGRFRSEAKEVLGIEEKKESGVKVQGSEKKQ